MGAGGCWVGSGAAIGTRGSRYQQIGAWLGGSRDGAPRAPTSVRNVSASERAHASPSPLGRAEQRSVARSRAGACLSVASLRTTPGGASSARQPAGTRPLARLFFGYFLLAKQKKVTRPTGRNPDLKTSPFFCLLFFSKAKKRKVRPASGSKPASRPKPDFQNPATQYLGITTFI